PASEHGAVLVPLGSDPGVLVQEGKPEELDRPFGRRGRVVARPAGRKLVGPVLARAAALAARDERPQRQAVEVLEVQVHRHEPAGLEALDHCVTGGADGAGTGGAGVPARRTDGRLDRHVSPPEVDSSPDRAPATARAAIPVTALSMTTIALYSPSRELLARLDARHGNKWRPQRLRTC